jgi:hypothetical protein
VRVLYLLEEAGASWQHRSGKWDVPLESEYGKLHRQLIKAILRRMRAEGQSEETVAERMADVARLAVERGRLAALRALLEEGFDMTRLVAVERDGERFLVGLLTLACVCGDQAVVSFLVEQGCDPLRPDPTGLLPHHSAAAGGRLPVLRWLMNRCAETLPVDTEAVGAWGRATALHGAAEGGHLDVVKWLVGAGADVLRLTGEWKDGVKRRASELAAAKGHSDVAVFLREQEEMATRRARNEKRRQKQKKAKARRQRGDEAGAAGGGGEEEEEAGEAEQQEQQQQQQEEEEASEALTAGAAGLTIAAPAPAVAEQKQEQEEEEANSAATAPAPARAPPVLRFERPPPLQEYVEAHAPDDFTCPISLALLVDPVVLAGDGFTYSRAAIEQHLGFRRERGLPLTSRQDGPGVG